MRNKSRPWAFGFSGLIVLAVVSGFSLRANADAASDAKVVQEITSVDKAYREAKGEAKAAFMAPDISDVHGSGWLYNKEQSQELEKNTEALWPERMHVIYSHQSDFKVRVYGADMALVTGISEVYVAVPNPEDVAIANGTLTRSPEAIAKWIAQGHTPANTESAGEIDRPNPYRARYLRVWVRQGGKWEIAASQQTRIGGRDGHVRLEGQP